MNFEALLREYVRGLIEIRSKNDIDRDDKKYFGSKFNMSVFKKFSDRKTMLDYASALLDKLGTGSSRTTFLLSSKRVLKVARNDAGIAQNNVEIAVATDPKTSEFVTQIYQSADDGMWIVSDVVRAMSINEFNTMIGCKPSDVLRFLRSVKAHGLKKMIDYAPSKFAIKLAHMMIDSGLEYIDLITNNHWGFTADGKAVILDYGFNSEVDEKYYSAGTEVASWE